MTSELLPKTRTDKQGIKLEDGSIDGLEAGKYNIDWKLECRKRTKYRSRMYKWSQVKLLDQDNTRNHCQVQVARYQIQIARSSIPA